MKPLFKQTLAGLRVLLVFTVLLGVVYPLGVWAVSRIPGLEGNAEGSIITQNGQAVGSARIGVDPVAADPAKDPWFHNRPSAGSKDVLGPGDPSSSGPSNKGPYNEDLVAAIGERKKLIAAREGVQESQVPADAVTASGSGMDPAISVAYADLQIPRVARNTGLSEEKVRQLVAENTSGAGIGVPGVNVLKVNLAVRDAAGGAH
ncbi:potassium-transporting ATPase subunit C [Amycolatopsis japonica]|uniref:Potassium-transporting ATPase KdpC subunit n=1 Tax=Amycolatopsis keratiniphila subsp. keratiniphila TaxID=227715 RepID=A0A1W2LYV2_9PSEU|nr:potassium-transporting ATPase subunit C [Amycolatopsis keratiniphila]OLZ58929.1 K+-transporting ATPase subunit C [Amycolatopsis keratiniphila subsp. nogabecina]ONF72404.1 K+-transporting ATPase subunit C [Amycolatopsis keratiniphila subsp. keratiniphila]SDU70559.1 K+-transporting ATPase ATPase C chain [Amycolatopsis keratiniphila]